MTHLEIDRERCARDGLCALECPLSLIDIDEAGYPVATAHLEASCIGCGHCAAVCAKGCLRIDGIDPDELPAAPRTPDILPEALCAWMTGRRSVRNFSDRRVPRGLIETCLETARYAPSALNFQPVEWLVMTDPAAIRTLAGLCADFFRAAGSSPRFIEPFDAGRETILRDAPCLVVVHADAAAPIPPATDCVIALTHFELAAHALGLGTCWAGLVRRAVASHAPAREFLGLPPGHEMYGGLMVGFPRFAIKRLPPRKPLSIIWR